MNVYQVICTKRKKGMLQDTCFETTGMSQGAGEDEADEILDRFRSTVPDYNEEDTQNIPPEVYSFFKLKSGRYCVCSIKPMLDDKEGQFCHAIICGDEYWPYYPVQLIGSSVFRESIDREACAGEILPVLTDVREGSIITYDRVSQFAKERLKLGIREMINAVVDYKKWGRGIIICDSEENNYLWIAATMISFPVSIAHAITFTTWGINGSSDYMVQCPDIKNLPDWQEDRANYIFDYKRGIRGNPDIKLKFTRIVDIGYLVSRKTLESFHKFLMQSSYTILDEDIDGCYNLFIMVNYHETDIENSDIKCAFDFALKYGTQDMLDDIFQMLEPYMDKIVRAADAQTAKYIAEFMVKTAINSKKLILLDRVCYFFYSMMDHLVMDLKHTDVESLFKLYKDTAGNFGEKARIFFRWPVNNERIGYLLDNISANCTPEKAEFYLRVMFYSLMELEYLWSQALCIDKMAIFMDLCASFVIDDAASMERVLYGVSGNESFFARVTMLFYNRIKADIVMEKLVDNFASLMATKDNDLSLGIRKQIFDMEGSRLLFGEYCLCLERAQDMVEFFNNYCSNVFYKLPEYEIEYFSQAVKLYIKRLPSENIYNECLKFLEGVINNDISLDNEAISVVVKGFEEGVSLSSPDDELRELIPKVRKTKKTMGIITSLDATGLIDFGLWLERIAGQPYSIEEILKEAPGIGRINEERYDAYINWCIPLIMYHINSDEDHKRLIHLLNTDGMDMALFTVYLGCLENIIDRDRQRGRNILLQFCVYFFFYLEPRYKILEEAELLERVKGILINVLLKQPRSFINDMDYGLKSEFGARGLSIPVEWGNIKNEVMSKKSSPIVERIQNMFKKN